MPPDGFTPLLASSIVRLVIVTPSALVTRIFAATRPVPLTLGVAFYRDLFRQISTVSPASTPSCIVANCAPLQSPTSIVMALETAGLHRANVVMRACFAE